LKVESGKLKVFKIIIAEWVVLFFIQSRLLFKLEQEIARV